MKIILATVLLITSGHAMAGDYKGRIVNRDPNMDIVNEQLRREGYGPQRVIINPDRIVKVERVPVYRYERVMVANPCFVHYERRLPLILCGDPATVTRTGRYRIATEIVTTYADGSQSVTTEPYY